MSNFRSTKRWMKKQIRRCRRPGEERKIVIGPPTNFRREDITFSQDCAGDAMLIEQAREDAMNMHKVSKMQGLKNHARRVSHKYGRTAVVEGNLH